MPTDRPAPPDPPLATPNPHEAAKNKPRTPDGHPTPHLRTERIPTMTHQSAASVALTAHNPQTGVTLQEMADLTNAALHADIPLDQPVLVRIGWRNQIRRATIGRQP